MVEVENRHWKTIEHSPFAMPYAGQIIVHSFSGEELSETEQVQAAAHLSESGDGLRTITLDTDEFLPRFTLTLRMEAESDKDAVKRLCGAAIDGWAAVGKDTDDLELVEAHLVYEPELKADRETDASADISDAHYTVEDLELPELDDFGSPVRLEVREVFYRAREATS
jgi:hypothetical protein